MSTDSGWIKLHRKILKWEWYDDINTKVLFFHLLLTVNHEDRKWHGILIKRGQRLTSIKKLASETRLSLRQTRTALTKLISTNELTNESTSQYRIITINNYCQYQKATNELTNERQTSDKRATTNKNDKNIRIDIDHFSDFWSLYPRKIGKKKALQIYTTLIRKNKELPVIILDGLKRQLKELSSRESQYIPHPSTWLNQGRWEDEVNTSAIDSGISKMKKIN